MKNLILNYSVKAVIILFLASLNACALAQEKETRRIEDFDAIDVGQGIDVYLYQDKTYFVEIESDIDLDDVKTELRGRTLHIAIDKGMLNLSWNNNVKVYVHLPELISVNCSGGADVVGESSFAGDEIRIHSSGGGDVKMELQYGNIDVDCSGGADAALSGRADRIKADVSGGSDLKAYDLEVKEANLDCSGGADIEITVSDMIKANASGGANIRYKGDPEIMDVHSSGGGDITKR